MGKFEAVLRIRIQLQIRRIHMFFWARVQLRCFTYLSSLDHSSPQLVSFLHTGDQLYASLRITDDNYLATHHSKSGGYGLVWGSIADPDPKDPYVFGPPESGSIS